MMFRRRRRSTVLILLCIFFVAILFYTLPVLFGKTKSEDSVYRNEAEKKLYNDLMEKYNETLLINQIDEDPFHSDNDIDFRNFEINFKETNYKPEDLIPIIDKLNERQITYNKDKFNLEISDIKAVIIIQVHKRVEYLKELLDSLQHAKGIDKAILVFSHDFYSDKVNDLVRKVDFCQMIQIFFPYALQLYPEKFPGQSPDDCPRDISKEQALKNGCQNAETPDQYGHYREAHITMTKHHWWWKINRLLDQLDTTKKFDGPFLFLEEDHYVAPSFLDALTQLHHIKKSDSRCKNSCDILTLGNYNEGYSYSENGGKAFLSTWISQQHNMGMALYRETWEKIKKCSETFCKYDDYNWDWTLMHISQTCIDRLLNVLVYEVPRVFHVGDCGLHHKDNCGNAKETLHRVKNILKENSNHLYQKAVLIEDNIGNVGIVANGGWGDPRDHDLCLSFVRNDETNII